VFTDVSGKFCHRHSSAVLSQRACTNNKVIQFVAAWLLNS
jgi:hypothetical protein